MWAHPYERPSMNRGKCVQCQPLDRRFPTRLDAETEVNAGAKDRKALSVMNSALGQVDQNLGLREVVRLSPCGLAGTWTAEARVALRW